MRKEYPLHEKRRIENGWDIDLIWCPSQIYKTFTVNQKEYRIYLRWRFDDPWGFFIDMEPIAIKDYLAEEYEELIDYIDNHIEEIIKEHREIK